MEVGVRPKLTEDDLVAARERLERFDEVLVLEELHVRDRFRLRRYGWVNLEDCPPPRVDELGLDHTAADPLGLGLPSDGRVNATALLAADAKLLALLRQVQRWDLQLYEFGAALARRRAAPAAAAVPGPAAASAPAPALAPMGTALSGTWISGPWPAALGAASAALGAPRLWAVCRRRCCPKAVAD